jgi:hypothetical protein
VTLSAGRRRGRLDKGEREGFGGNAARTWVGPARNGGQEASEARGSGK